MCARIFVNIYFLHMFILTHHRSTAQCLGKPEKHQLYRELRNCLDIVEPIDGKPLDEVVGFWNCSYYMFLVLCFGVCYELLTWAFIFQVERVKSAATSLRSLLVLPSFSDISVDNGPVDMMDEDSISNLSIRLKLSLTVWDFILPATPSLPAVIGVSWTHALYNQIIKSWYWVVWIKIIMCYMCKNLRNGVGFLVFVWKIRILFILILNACSYILWEYVYIVPLIR